MKGKRRSLWRAAFSRLPLRSRYRIFANLFLSREDHHSRSWQYSRGVGERRVRAVIPYLSKYIPGNPTIVMEFMPGAGGRKAANYMFHRARPDGLALAHIGSGLITNSVLGETGVEYDTDKFIYLGTPNTGTHYSSLKSSLAEIFCRRGSSRNVDSRRGKQVKTDPRKIRCLEEVRWNPKLYRCFSEWQL
jgi:hypothetical protein